MRNEHIRVTAPAVILSLLLGLLAGCGGEAPDLEGTLEMPVFTFDSSCVLTIENLDPQLHYEIRSGGNSLGIYMAQDMENYRLPWGKASPSGAWTPPPAMPTTAPPTTNICGGPLYSGGPPRR